MNKAQLIDSLSAQLGSKKAATDAVDGVIDAITRAVARGERVAITGFGVFDKVARPARTGRNPRTGAAVKIKKTSVPKFKAGQSFKDVVSGAKKLPKAVANAATSATGRSTGASSTAKKAAPARKTATTKKAAPARKTATAKKAAPAKKTTARKTTATKSTARKTTATKTTARKAPAKRAAKR
ncbi:MAG: DNA-binding protein HU-beta [Actinomycetota bacterium]|nr:DNA-binding protein HU-beta [Actinomycetota bacterium]